MQHLGQAGGIPWTLVSGGMDSALVVDTFSTELPRGSRLVVKADKAMLETYDGSGICLDRVKLAPPAAPGTLSTLMSQAGAFGSLVVVEENRDQGREHVYQADICVLPASRPRGST